MTELMRIVHVGQESPGWTPIAWSQAEGIGVVLVDGATDQGKPRVHGGSRGVPSAPTAPIGWPAPDLLAVADQQRLQVRVQVVSWPSPVET